MSSGGSVLLPSRQRRIRDVSRHRTKIPAEAHPNCGVTRPIRLSGYVRLSPADRQGRGNARSRHAGWATHPEVLRGLDPLSLTALARTYEYANKDPNCVLRHECNELRRRATSDLSCRDPNRPRVMLSRHLGCKMCNLSFRAYVHESRNVCLNASPACPVL
jgi:hypothetical protein